MKAVADLHIDDIWFRRSTQRGIHDLCKFIGVDPHSGLHDTNNCLHDLLVVALVSWDLEELR